MAKWTFAVKYLEKSILEKYLPFAQDTFKKHLEDTKIRYFNKNSSGDEIANVNFFYNIAHVEASAYAH